MPTVMGEPRVPPLCRETSVSRTANVGTVSKNWLRKRNSGQKWVNTIPAWRSPRSCTRCQGGPLSAGPRPPPGAPPRPWWGRRGGFPGSPSLGVLYNQHVRINIVPCKVAIYNSFFASITK